MSGVYKVLIADITLSFDNVLGVAGAAKGSLSFIIFWFIFISCAYRSCRIILCKIYSRAPMGWLRGV